MAGVNEHRRNEDTRILLVFLLAFVVRLALQFTTLPSFLADRIELSTPVTSYKRLREGLYLYDHGIDPYDGGVCHQAPILLALLSSITALPQAALAEKVLYSVLDLAVTYKMLEILSSTYVKIRVSSTYQIRPWVFASIALLNPFSLLITTSRSSASFTSLAIVTALSNGISGQKASSMFCLALATYLSVYPALLVPPSIILLHGNSRSSFVRTALSTSFTYVSFLFAMLYMSSAWLGSWNFFWSNYNIVLQMTDLTPNVGLWWYFFTEMFEDFRKFFLGVFQLHLLIYVLPLCIRFSHDPFFVCITLCGLSAIFKPYPSIADTNLYLTLLTVYPHLFQHTKYLFLVACALLYCCIFGPAFYYLWIYAGSGNANFFYAITLVWNLAQGILLSDTIFATLKEEWEQEEPEKRLGKNLEVSQIAD